MDLGIKGEGALILAGSQGLGLGCARALLTLPQQCAGPTALQLVPGEADELGDVLVFGGGVIPDADARALQEQGVAKIFGPGSSLKAIGEWLETALDETET